jgi:phosphinothricin acetyltransferase
MTVLRLATSADSKAILDIYAPYIQNTSFTFETEVPSLKEFSERITAYLNNWPWLVCEINGKIAGYAYATKYRERTAYQWCVESSIYIQDDFQKAGVGKSLYSALFEILKKQGFNNVYAVINLPNEKSVAFHEKLGFHYFATYEKVGYKLGKWKNVGWWGLSINEYVDEPAAPIKFSELDKEFLPGLFSNVINLLND